MLDFETFTHEIEASLEMIGVGIDVLGVCVICAGIVAAAPKTAIIDIRAGDPGLHLDNQHQNVPVLSFCGTTYELTNRLA